MEGGGSVVLRDSHHFDTWLETGAFLLIDHIDFNGVGFCDCGPCHGPTAKIVLCFVGNSHFQVDHL